MEKISIQEQYSNNLSHCYGCGHLNDRGLQIKSYWDGELSNCEFTPEPYHTAVPGYVYGGLIASLIDCHATATACAAAYEQECREIGSEPILRFLTASLHVDYLKPTPINTTLLLKGKAVDIVRRKVKVEVEVIAQQQICAIGKVLTVQIPDKLLLELAIK